MPDGKIKFNIETDINQAQKDLSKFSKEVDKAGRNVESLQAKLKTLQLNRAMGDANSPTTKAIKATTDALTIQEERLKELQVEYAHYHKLADDALKQNPNFSKYDKLRANPNVNAGLLSANAKNWGIDLKQYEQYRESISIAAQAEKNFNTVKETAIQLNKKLAELREKQQTEQPIPKSEKELAIEREIADAIKRKAEAEQDYANAKANLDGLLEVQRKKEDFIQIASSVKNLALNLSKAALSATKFVLSLPLKKLISGFNKLTNGVKRFGQRLKFVILQGLIFRNLRKYLSEFASSIGEALNKNQEFSASLANLKGAFWSAIAPVIDVIAPILAKFLNLIATLISYLSALISLLFGVAKASGAAGQALTDAGEAGKSASKNLASWDTIQNLDSGSGGGASGGISPTFGQDFDTAYEKLEWLRKLLEEGDWFKIGYRVGEIFNSIIAKFDSFVKKLRIKLASFAKNISDFINGFVTSFKSYNLGAAISEVLNSVINAIGVFFENLWATDLGVSVGNFFNGLFENLDVERLAQTVSAVIRKTLQFAIGLLKQTDFDMIGQKIGVFLKNLDWAGIITDVIELIGNIIKAPIELLFGIIGGIVGGETDKLISKSDEVTKSVEGTTKELRRNAEQRKKQLDDIQAQSRLTDDLIGRLYTLANKSDKSNQELAEMSGIVETLNSLYPDLNLYLDIQNESLSLSEEEVRKYTNSLLEQYKAEALKEQIIQSYKDLYAAEKAEADAKEEYRKLYEKYNDTSKWDIITRMRLLNQLDDARVAWMDAITVHKDVEKENQNLTSSLSTLLGEVNSVTSATEEATREFDNMVYVAEDGSYRIDKTFKSWSQKWGNTINDSMRPGLNAAISSVEEAVRQMANGLNSVQYSAGGRNYGFNITVPRLERLAKGTVVNPGHEFAAILGDNRHEQEVVSPLSTMKQALLEALQESGMSDGGQVILNIDGRQVATAIVPHMNNASRAYGRSVIR